MNLNTFFVMANEKMCVILGDNIFQESISDHIKLFESTQNNAHVLLKQVNDPDRFGVATLNETNKIIEIIEKPKNPKSNYAVTGLYFYDETVFDVIKTCKPSKRGELEISEVNNYYVKENKINHSILNGWWTDAGTFESIKLANDLVMEQPINE